MISTPKNIQHLYWRAGFGPAPDLNIHANLENEIETIFAKSSKFIPITLRNIMVKPRGGGKSKTAEQKKEFRDVERAGRLEIITQVFERQAHSEACLREKMTMFWMGHFACRTTHPQFTKDYYNTISQNALGKFDVLLSAMIRNSALLAYLNNNLNRKSKPNENFARELMELFTLGIGNYTEQDVKEGARSFTGWGFDTDGNFLLREQQHDDGTKTFLGKSGNFDGAAIAKIILQKKECSHFITSKIYKYFVNNIPDNKIIAELSTSFFDSGYDIEKLMRKIFTSEWFYNNENVGSKIKSPIELLAGMIKMFNINFENPLARFPIQKVLGQVIFNPPNVAGWPEGRNWIDSSTMIYRTRLPQVLLQNAEVLITPKEDFDAQDTMDISSGNGSGGRRIRTNIQADTFIKKFKNQNERNNIGDIVGFLLQTDPNASTIQLIENYTASYSGDLAILKTADFIMSLPEYQMC